MIIPTLQGPAGLGLCRDSQESCHCAAGGDGAGAARSELIPLEQDSSKAMSAAYPRNSGSLQQIPLQFCVIQRAGEFRSEGMVLTCDSRVQGDIPPELTLCVFGEENLLNFSLREIWNDFESLQLIHRACLGSNPSHMHSSSWAPA